MIVNHVLFRSLLSFNNNKLFKVEKQRSREVYKSFDQIKFDQNNLLVVVYSLYQFYNFYFYYY